MRRDGDKIKSVNEKERPKNRKREGEIGEGGRGEGKERWSDTDPILGTNKKRKIKP